MPDALSSIYGTRKLDEREHLLRCLKRQVMDEVFAQVRDPSCWVVTTLESGLFIERSVGCLQVSRGRMDYARDLVTILNQAIPRNGRWVCVWCEPSPDDLQPQRLIAMWKDPDGDVPFAPHIEMRWEELSAIPAIALAETINNGYGSYEQHLLSVGVRPEHMRKFAQGQRTI